MQNALQGALQQLAQIISGLSPAAKAITAAVLPLASAVLNMAIAGSFDTTSLVLLAVGAITSLTVYLVPNKATKPAPVPAKAAAKAKGK